MAITETAAASSAAAEAADAAVHGPDLSMGTEHLTDAIADTTNYFVVFFEKRTHFNFFTVKFSRRTARCMTATACVLQKCTFAF